MSEPGRKWIIKDAEGKIYGPFVTSKVLRQIEKGYFSGGEMIAPYPGGTWIAISKAPEFYDKLLDVLASEGKARSAKSSQANPSEAESSAPTPPPIEPMRPRGKVVRELPDGDEAPSKAHEPNQPGLSKIEAPQPSENVIELTDLKSLERDERKRSAKLPLLLIVGAAVLVFIAISFRPEPAERGLRLLLPRKGQPEVSEAEAVKRLDRGLALFQQDTFTTYVRAQAEIVQIIEGAPKLGKAYAALCLTYRELWPYTSRSEADQKAFAQVMQDAKRLDPAGFHGATCEIAYLLANDRYPQARGLTDTWISVQTQASVLYEITAEFLSSERKWIEGVGYAEQARVLWPRWMKPYVTEARMRTGLRQYTQAMQLYRTVLNTNPRHQVARVELGLLEFRQFNQQDKAFEMLKIAVDSDETLPREIEFAAYLALAQIYERKNSTSQALEYAKRAFGLNPNDPVSRQIIMRLGDPDDLELDQPGSEIFSRGDQYVRAGDCVAAQAEYKAAFEADPKNATAAMKAGKCLWQLNRSADAIEWLKKAIVADPKLTQAYILLADYYSQRFDYLSAMRSLQKIQQIAPKSFEVYRGFAQVELRRNNYQGAANFCKQALKLYEADTETYTLMAQAQKGLGNTQEAQKFAQRAIELEPSHIDAQSLYALLLLDTEGIDAALLYVESLISSYQQVVDYRVTKGELLFNEERFGDAVTALREARSLDKANKKALLLLGRALHAQGQNPDAMKAFLEAAEMDPSDANPLFMAGMLYSEDNRTLKDAVRQFQRVLKINPRYPRAHVQLGQAYLRQGSFQEALGEAELERSINPELADAYVLAADAYFSMKQYTNCAGEYQKAVARRANDTAIYVKMARCYRLSGAVDSAMSLLNQAKAKESGNADIYKELGATFHVRGMPNEALEAYGQYLALVPNAADRAEVEAIMRQIQSGDLSFEKKE